MSGSRSNSEEQDKVPLGTGLLDGARRSLAGRSRSIEDALEAAEGSPKKPKKPKPPQDDGY